MTSPRGGRRCAALAGATRRGGAASLGLDPAAALVVALGLRLWLEHGLPWVYNRDEELHFVPVAVRDVRRLAQPALLREPAGADVPVLRRLPAALPSGGPCARVRGRPDRAYETARVVVALIGTLVAGLVYWAGARVLRPARRPGRRRADRVRVPAAFYGKFALNDAVTLAPVAIALVGCLLV